MFEWVKNLFKKETESSPSNEKPAPLLVTIHGFGVRRSVEMDQFVAYAKDVLPDVVTFDLFDIEKEEDNDPSLWIERAKAKMEELCHSEREIYLLGFSMGGVIASYLATLYPVKKLILIAPAFIHFSIENYTNIVINEASKLVRKEKKSDKPSMPKSFYNGFLDVIKEYKNAICDVQCPVLILQGDDDEVIPPRSSEWAYEQIRHNQKRLAYLHGGKHRILEDELVKDMAYNLINDFIHDELLPVNVNEDKEKQG